MEIILIIATILGGVAAVWYFWDKLSARNSSSSVPAASTPVEKWVDYNYPRDSGLQARLEQAGFKVAWCLDNNVARKVDLEGWEIIVEPDAQGVLSKYRLKDRPDNQTLVRKR